MRPLITPEEMRRVDAAATEPLTSIIERVGALVAMHAIDMMGGTYGRRVVVLAGPGNNGADGRAAARYLGRRGVRCTVLATDETPGELPSCDLVIDGAFGTGLSRDFHAPVVDESSLVLSIDIPSGFDGLTGQAKGSPFRAHRTVVLDALKPGNLFEPARSASGELRIIDIGLDATELIDPSSFKLEAADIAAWLPTPQPATHKWKSACWVVAGSPGMIGAAELTVRGAQRGGATYIRLSAPGVAAIAVTEAVVTAMTAAFDTEDAHRFAAMVVGPGLGRDENHTEGLLNLMQRVELPLVIDADALWHLKDADTASFLKRRVVPAVLTPHDGEFVRAFGFKPGTDRIEAARFAAEESGCVVLLKGPTTVIAAPGRPSYVMAEGDSRLATAGTGDVLSGLIGALLARGMAPREAAAAGAFVHARAAAAGSRSGFVAGDLPRLLPVIFDDLVELRD